MKKIAKTHRRVPESEGLAAWNEAFLRSTGEGVVLVDQQARVLTVNGVAEKMTGLKSTSLVGTRVNATIRIQDARGRAFAPKDHPVALALASGNHVESKNVRFLLKKDGSRIPVLITITPVILKKIPAGAIINFREAWLFEGTRSGVLLVSGSDRRITAVNETACKIFGMRAVDVIDQALTSLFVSGDRDYVSKMIESVQEQRGIIRADLAVKTPERLPVDIELSCATFTFGKESILQCSFHDITERMVLQRNREDRLKTLELSMSDRARSIEREQSVTLALIQSIPDGIIAVDSNENITRINSATEGMIGWKAEEIIGRSIFDILPLSDEDGPVPVKRQPMRVALMTGKPVVTSLENAPFVTRKDGSVFPTHVSAAPVLADGHVVGGVMVFHDITREKDVERSKTEFISIASHQLRTPLSTISWYAEALLSGHLGVLTENQRRYAEEIGRMDARMIELVNALLCVSRIELGTFHVREESVLVTEVADAVLAELAHPIRERGLRVSRDYAQGKTSIVADRSVVHMILQNLIANAVYYNRNGGKLDISISVDGGAHISISDTGVGIPKASQQHLFKKFYRADNAREFRPDGTGIGLYIVRSLLWRFGGSVWFESEEGVGSTFFVNIPVVPQAALPNNHNSHEPTL